MVSSISYLGKIRPKHDYSYGIYIYGFICQQIIAQVWPDLSGYWALSLALLLTLVFASFSCHLIEEPSIRFIKRYSSPL
jgi:peptidoglycan/LPS O-acetylase OafA/YrhL